MLRKKTNGVARRSQRTGILSDVAEKSVDRRAFLRGSGLAIGGLAAISATGGSVTQAYGSISRQWCCRDYSNPSVPTVL